MSRQPYHTNMSNEDYWIQRDKDKDKSLKKKEDELVKELEKAYKQAFKDIKFELYEFYDKYAKDNKISMTEARKSLSAIDIKKYKNKLDELNILYKKTGNEKYLMEYKKLSARAKVTRLISLLDTINVELSKISVTVQTTIEDYLIGLYTDEYSDILKEFNIKNDTNINTDAIKEIINYPYAGKQFSDRVWSNKEKLLNYIENDLTTGLIRGLSIQKMSRQLMDKLEVLYYEAERLVRTETNYIQNQAHMQGYKDAGLKRYRIDAHLDSRTSDICRELDGKVFNMEDAVVGVNFPPLHPSCRTRITPVVDDIKKKYNIND